MANLVEQQGIDFSAVWAGKVKMVVQCAAAAVCLYRLAWPESAEVPTWLDWTVMSLVWAAVVSTVYSGVGYIVAAAKVLRK